MAKEGCIGAMYKDKYTQMLPMTLNIVHLLTECEGWTGKKIWLKVTQPSKVSAS